MIIVNQNNNVSPYFRAEPVADHNVESLGELSVSITSGNYFYVTIDQAINFRDALNDGIALAKTAREARYLKAVAAVADLTERGMGEVSE
jgi:proline racemase